MSISIPLLLGLGFALACVNGANDVSKGIATLVGSGLTSHRRAILWGATWTAAGGGLGAIAAKAMLETFGSGLLASEARPTLMAAAATLIGAAGWVWIATQAGLPVSTTHAIVGALAGVGLRAGGCALGGGGRKDRRSPAAEPADLADRGGRSAANDQALE